MTSIKFTANAKNNNPIKVSAYITNSRMALAKRVSIGFSTG